MIQSAQTAHIGVTNLEITQRVDYFHLPSWRAGFVNTGLRSTGECMQDCEGERSIVLHYPVICTQ